MKQNNFKNFLKGTLTIFGIFSLIGVVFAVGFHSADEILGGIFSGDYKFTGNLQLNNSNSVCDSSNEGGLKVLNGNLNLCDGTVWNIINNSDDNQGETVLLLHFDNNYLDSSNSVHTVSTVGSPTVSSAGKFGNSLYIPGYGSYIRIPEDIDFAFGDEDFTIDFWLKFNNVLTDTQTIFDQGNDGGGSNGVRLLRYTNPSVMWQFAFGDSAETRVNLFSGSDSISNGVWNHFAVIRYGNFWRIYVNGNLIGETEVDTKYHVYGFPFAIGEFHTGYGADGNDIDNFVGYIDEFRIVKGKAMWTSNFTPPSEPYS